MFKYVFLGDTELNDYMDSLARDPNKFITPHNADTGETILHLLAKEGKMEILHNLLEDSRVEKDLVRALLQQVKSNFVKESIKRAKLKQPTFF
jgi:hypothetical protein